VFTRLLNKVPTQVTDAFQNDLRIVIGSDTLIVSNVKSGSIIVSFNVKAKDKPEADHFAKVIAGFTNQSVWVFPSFRTLYNNEATAAERNSTALVVTQSTANVVDINAAPFKEDTTNVVLIVIIVIIVVIVIAVAVVCIVRMVMQKKKGGGGKGKARREVRQQQYGGGAGGGEFNMAAVPPRPGDHTA
jgi:heme/copper-type cytochrome/quinol oxidase subunit 2